MINTITTITTAWKENQTWGLELWCLTPLSTILETWRNVNYWYCIDDFDYKIWKYTCPNKADQWFSPVTPTIKVTATLFINVKYRRKWRYTLIAYKSIKGFDEIIISVLKNRFLTSRGQGLVEMIVVINTIFTCVFVHKSITRMRSK
jgi:hypothetical protein